MKKVERWREKKVRESKVYKNVLTFIKRKMTLLLGTYQNDKMTLLHGMEGVKSNLIELILNWKKII